MHYRRLGRSGLKVSEISFGAWVTFGGQVDEAGAVELVQAAYEQGINYFDNADVYANGQAEVLMGKAIQRSAARVAGYLHKSVLPQRAGSEWARTVSQAPVRIGQCITAALEYGLP
jgi:predicted aldo/keto reductase-like oxidoreductase